MVLYVCVFFFLWVLSLRYGGLCFYWVPAQGSSKKKVGKSEILDDFINISPIHSLCVAFCFFFLCFLWGLCSHIS